MRFSSDSAGNNLLNFEIDTFTNSGVSSFWVSLPTLATNTTFYAWWGGSTTTLPATSTNGATWKAAGYVAVWHFGSAIPNSTTNFFVDSATTNTGKNMTGYTMPNAAGQIGNATSLNGYEPGIQFPAISLGNANYSVSAWAKRTTDTTSQMSIISTKDTYYGTLLGQQHAGAGDPWDYWCTDQRDGSNHPIGGTEYMASWNFGVTTWQHVVITRNASRQFQPYNNGSANGSIVTGDTYGTTPDTIGVYASNLSTGNKFVGLLDEIRIATNCFSAAWVWAEYQTSANNATLQTYGTIH